MPFSPRGLSLLHGAFARAFWVFACAFWGSMALCGSIANSTEPTVHEELRIEPEEIRLSQFQPHQLVRIRGLLADGSLSAALPVGATSDAEIQVVIEAPEVAKWIEDDRYGATIHAMRSGTTRLVVRWKDSQGAERSTMARIVATGIEEPVDWEFGNHVQSVLSRSGCNMGACHGALAGKGGFRLSLRGYDADTDHFNITRQDLGRRVELSAPSMSLVVSKPSGVIEHKGGVRLPTSASDYRLMLDWIARGAKGPRESDPTLVKLEVLPEAVQLARGDQEQLIVRAHYSNGRIEDVTRWAKFNSSDESIALVDEYGKLKIIGPGQGAVVAWFASRIVMARVRVPFVDSTQDRPSLLDIQTAMGRANAIDDHVANQLFLLGLMPSRRVGDAEFLRRSSLDATGTLPTQAQVEAFLADSSPDKRAKWIDGLLASPEFVDYWAYRWSDMLMLNSNLLRADGVRAYYQWIRSQVERNTPWDVLVREILVARGEALENGATNFYAINQDPEGMTENACQAFLGLSIGCAKCHNHPLEKWTNDQYYAMANMFARVRAKGWGGEVRDGDSARTVYVVDRGDLIQPLRGKPQPPAPLDAEPIDKDSPEDRRVVLAQWMTAPENPYFTDAIVNRVWAAFFGIGIVNAVDDLRASNPASNPELMRELRESLIADKYDLKSLMRRIMNSETYQRSSEVADGNRDDQKYFSRYYPRRLMAEVILDAITSVTEIPSDFTKVSFLGGDKRDTKFYPKGTRAIQLFDSSVDSNFLKTFGRNQRRITCECERSDEPSIIQVLNLSNGDTLNQKLSEPGGIVDAWMERGEDHRSLIRTAYLRALSRFPTETELSDLEKEMSQPDLDPRIAVEDLLWSLMASKEFLFNH